MKNILFALVLSLIFSNVYAQSQDKMTFAVVEKIQSKELEEERILNIYLPQGYEQDTATYPTLYVLDGSAHEDFPHVAGLAQFLQMYNLMPKTIVVGISNVDRYRDFTFPSQDTLDLQGLPTSGGGERFMKFIENELQPFMEKQYNVNDHKTIIGQSLGGLMATEILMKKEYLFNDYIIVSPSLWWNQQALIKTANDHFKGNTSLKGKVFVTLGKEHPVMEKVAKQLYKAIKKSGNTDVQVFFNQIKTEDHATILHRAVYKALEAFYPKVENKH